MKITKENLDSILALNENWDGYGAHKISQQAVGDAVRLLEAIQIIPCKNGGVQLELHHSSGIEFEIELDSDGDVCGFLSCWDRPNHALMTGQKTPPALSEPKKGETK